MAKQKDLAAPAPPKSSIKFNKETAVKYYLLAYNTLAAIGWTYILISLLIHFFSPTAALPAQAHQQPSTKASNIISHYISLIPFFKSATINTTPAAQIQSRLHPLLVPYYLRASTAYTRVGEVTAWVQTLAVLEVVHALAGIVRSPVKTTAMQVASRLALVWVIVENYEVARKNPLYASMVLAWSITESIRYLYYASSLLSFVPYPLLYLRYSTFYILYPLGASSEAFLIYSTLPKSSPYPVPTWKSWVWGIWTISDYVRGGMFLVWWPALYFLYVHMIKQRRKVLGAGQGHVLGSKKTQ